MRQLLLWPQLHQFSKCIDFAKEFKIGKGDLIITNEYIYKPFFGELNLGADTLFQEKYGSGEPSDEMVDAMCRDIKGNHKRIIAIGGGTIIDIAKIFALKNVMPAIDLFDRKLEIVKDKELVLVPTTCGTGSEVTNIAILALKSRETKLGLSADEMYADDAVLIPELLNGLPFPFFAASSIDALIHACESVLSPKATAVTDLFGYKAIEIIVSGYKEIAKNGEKARLPLLGDFLQASCYAGIAFSNAGVGAVHAMSYPLGGKYHVPHGEANYALFVNIFKHYVAISNDGAIAKLNKHLASLLECGINDVYKKLEELLSHIMPLKPLRDYGVTKEDVKSFTVNVIEQQGRLTANNFVPLSAGEVEAIYTELY